ncbi:MAG: SIS domain-containing protein [Candidatus Zixiibacteriota bacterium]|nr:MAG: SIS domain-containing protein [candidate division Zixibacteria bacterium]
MTDRKNIIASAVRDAIALKTAYTQHREEWLLAASDQLANAFRSGNKVLIAGNGGSAADSQHFAAELVVRLSSRLDRQALPAIALTVDTSVLTAATNDYGFKQIFSRQIEALGNAGDVFIGLSTSGKSENIIEAFRIAKSKSLVTFGLFGEKGLSKSELSDLSLCVPSSSTMRIQEEHIFAMHLLVELTECLLFASATS